MVGGETPFLFSVCVYSAKGKPSTKGMGSEKKVESSIPLLFGVLKQAKMANNADILTTIQSLRVQLATLEAQLTGEKVANVPMAQAAPKPKRVASDALKAWNAYVDQVKADMLASGWTHPETGKAVTRKDAMQEASRRRATDPTAPKPKPKPVKDAEPAPSDGEAKPKPKRTLSDEQKAKMAAGRKAAAERRKAEAAAQTAAKQLPALPASEDEAEAQSELQPINIKAKRYLWNPENGACYKRHNDGSKGDYVGVLEPDSKTIDDSVKESDLE